MSKLQDMLDQISPEKMEEVKNEMVLMAKMEDHAIAFGEWIADKMYQRTYLLGDEVFTEGVWHQAYSSLRKVYTTEELYNLFLSSRL